MTDDELLTLLGHTFPADTNPPSATVMASLRSALDGAVTTARWRRPRLAAPRWASRSRAVAWCAGVAAVLASTGTAYAASGARLPHPIRAAAHAVGLPVDSPSLVEVHAAERRLERQLVIGNRRGIAQAAITLRLRLPRLDASDERRVNQDARLLLERADAVSRDGQSGPNAESGEAAEHRSSSEEAGAAPPSETPSDPASTESGSGPSTQRPESSGRDSTSSTPVPESGASRDGSGSSDVAPSD